MKTAFPNHAQLKHEWLLVDAQGKNLGRLASQVAKLLRGKHKPGYSPHVDAGDHVIVINAAQVVLTGNKEKDKKYYRHTGYPGGIKETTAAKLRAAHPIRLVENAVRGMLPKGPLGYKIFTKLKVYPDASHKHAAQLPRPHDETVQAR